MCIEQNILGVLAAQHRDNRGLSREEAELQYIREAVLLEAPLNAHLYRLRKSKNEAGPGRILLAICARGVRVYTEEETPRVFAWNNIGKLCFDVSVQCTDDITQTIPHFHCTTLETLIPEILSA